MADHPTKKRRTEKSTLPSTQTKSAFKQPRQADAPSSSASENEIDSSHESEDGSEVDNGAVASKPQNKEKKEKNPKSSKATADDEFDVSATSDNDNDNHDDNDEYDDPVSDSDSDNDVDDSDGNDSDSSLDSILAAQSNLNPSKKRKRNNPTVFATSLSKILNSNLSTKARADPVLVRARKGTTQVVDESKLELKAKRVLKEERRKELEKGRVKDILPTNVKNGVDLARVLERERALRKIAQRGVVRLFNAVRAAQVKSEEAREEVRRKGIVGLGKKEEKVTEMSKQGFLDLIQATPAK